MFTHAGPQQLVLRNDEIHDQFGRRQTDTQRVYVESKAFILRPKFVFIDGRTGDRDLPARPSSEENPLRREPADAGAVVVLRADGPPDSDFLSTLSSQKVKGTRFLLQ